MVIILFKMTSPRRLPARQKCSHKRDCEHILRTGAEVKQEECTLPTPGSDAMEGLCGSVSENPSRELLTTVKRNITSITSKLKGIYPLSSYPRKSSNVLEGDETRS